MPLRIIAPGRVYRCDSDVTHTPMFHQVEGLVVDEGISFANLKAVLRHFVEQFFEKPRDLRFRASYFPFTEPSAEVDIQCVATGPAAASASRPGGSRSSAAAWCTPTCFARAAWTRKRWQGYAFGMGVERLAMLRYSVNDLRLFFENDLRFLQQFNRG
jgi:phenylalanyl-tRNA synthetase alpha chain